MESLSPQRDLEILLFIIFDDNDLFLFGFITAFGLEFQAFFAFRLFRIDLGVQHEHRSVSHHFDLGDLVLVHISEDLQDFTR